MKYIPLLFVLAALIGLIWTVRVGGADGSWLAIVVPGLIAALWLGINKYRAGKWFTESSGGH
jgi:hypothetical protein